MTDKIAPPPPGGPYYPPPYVRRPTNSMAVAALVVGILSLISCQLFGIGSIWLGSRARAEIRASGEDGDAMALVGIILGWCSLALVALSALVAVVYFVVVGGFLLAAESNMP